MKVRSIFSNAVHNFIFFEKDSLAVQSEKDVVDINNIVKRRVGYVNRKPCNYGDFSNVSFKALLDSRDKLFNFYDSLKNKISFVEFLNLLNSDEDKLRELVQSSLLDSKTARVAPGDEKEAAGEIDKNS